MTSCQGVGVNLFARSMVVPIYRLEPIESARAEEVAARGLKLTYC